ncbi:unnamed protein product [Closterium sp. NIES-54]
MEGDWGDFQSGASGFLSAQNAPSSAAAPAQAEGAKELTASAVEATHSSDADLAASGKSAAESSDSFWGEGENGGGADAGMDFWGEVQALGGSGEAQALGGTAEAQATDGGSGNDHTGQMEQGAGTPLSPPPASSVDGGGVAAAATVAAPLAAPVAASAGSGLGFDNSGLPGLQSGPTSVQTVASAGYHSSPMASGGSHGPRSPTKADPHVASDPHYKHDSIQRPGAHHPSGFSAHMMSYSHSSPLRPSAPHAPHALDAHQRKSPTPPPPAAAAHPPFRGPAPAPGPALHSPLSARGPLSAPPVSHAQSHPPVSHPLQSHPPFQPPPPHSPPSRSLPSHPPPSHPPPSLPHPLSHPPLSHPPLSHPPLSHPPLSRPTHPPPGYRPPPQGPPGTAKPAGGATGGAAVGAGIAAAGGRGGVGAEVGALMSGSGAPSAANSTTTTTTTSSSNTATITGTSISSTTSTTSSTSSSSSSAFAARSSPPVSFRRMSSLDVKTSLDGLAVLARQGSWRAIVDKVVEGYKLAGLVQQLALRGYHVLALMKLRMYGAAAEELTLLGNLDSPQYRYEAHPGMYPGRKVAHAAGDPRLAYVVGLLPIRSTLGNAMSSPHSLPSPIPPRSHPSLHCLFLRTASSMLPHLTMQCRCRLSVLLPNPSNLRPSPPPTTAGSIPPLCHSCPSFPPPPLRFSRLNAALRAALAGSRAAPPHGQSGPHTGATVRSAGVLHS